MKSVVDLCAAPGGWSELAVKIMNHRQSHIVDASKRFVPKVIAVDCVPIYDIAGVTTLVGDITQPSTAQNIIELAGEQVGSTLNV